MPKPIQEILPPQKRTGRPHSYTPEIGAKIIAHIETGGLTKDILAEIDLSRQAFNEWCHNVPGFGDAVARARELSAGAIFDRMVEVAQSPTAETPEGERHRATLIETYKWALRHLNPRVYSDKVQIAAHVTNKTQDDATAASQAAAHLDRIGQNEAVKALVDLASQRKEQS